VVFAGAMARFLKRPSPSEAIIRIGRATTDVFIGRACWIVPVLHRAATLSLSTIGLTIRREGHEALVTKDFISTNLSAEFYIRVEPNEDDVKKAARTIGIDEGHANTDAIRQKAQQLLEPKLIGAIRAVAAQNDFLALHLNREHFAQEVGRFLSIADGTRGKVLERLPDAVAAIRGSGGDSLALVELLQGPEQRAVLDRLLALTTLLEGHADHVMDAAGPDVVPSVETIRARFTLRRRGGGLMDRLLRALLGVEAKVKQYAVGSAFTKYVVLAAGMDGFNRVWESPETLPTRAELADPASWLRRLGME